MWILIKHGPQNRTQISPVTETKTITTQALYEIALEDIIITIFQNLSWMWLSSFLTTFNMYTTEYIAELPFHSAVILTRYKQWMYIQTAVHWHWSDIPQTWAKEPFLSVKSNSWKILMTPSRGRYHWQEYENFKLNVLCSGTEATRFNHTLHSSYY